MTMPKDDNIHGRRRDYDPDNLPLRNDPRLAKRQAEYLRDHGPDQRTTDNSGISKHSVLWELDSILWPW